MPKGEGMTKLKEKLGKERLGETNYNYNGELMTIIKYDGVYKVTVMFDNGYVCERTYINFKEGSIKNNYTPSVYNKGFFGDGKYKDKINGKSSKMYDTWRSMIKRCYDKKEHERYPRYIGCEVFSHWLNFQNFGQWYEDNYYTIEGETMCLDKDILVKNNKLYSPYTCIFVPSRINMLFIKSNKARGDLPIGITKDGNKYMARCNCIDEFGNNIRKTVGRASTPIEAFELYKNFKESYIKQVADYYKDKIPKQLYEAMYNWKVEIDD